MKLAVIVLSYNTKDLTEDCLNSIFRKKWKTEMEVWVVDNASTDGSSEMVEKKFPQAELIKSDTNTGFSKGNNLGLKKAKADSYLLLNSDTIVLEGALDELEKFSGETDFGIVSCKLTFKDKSFQANAGDAPTFWPVFFWISGLDDILVPIREMLPSFHRKFKSYFKGEREVGWVSGTAMLIKKQVIEKIGVLDENIFMYGEDVEYCMRARKAGFKIGWTDKATIIHLGGASSNDPHLRQWMGEIRGLKYVYRKYFGGSSEKMLSILIYVFYSLRALAFLIVGKPKASLTYAKVLFQS